ncbi:MAG TPA: SDR family NAD(P)-dependent oxidoreductase [Acidimicrobiia bacterium]|jgi:NAD(P)-dependent dehydrogenase (short-subunit alcohol dehydrogenase family)|nr:SDR family NAD(P)-dependent oxidoreductase [Acidimicrobiia bacterium]
MQPEGIAAVTGASRGIGRAIALELARRGFDVVATMRDPAAGAGMSDEAADAGGRLRVQALDVTRPDTVRLPDGLRVLVNNAGVEREHLPVEETPLELWREMFETNVFGLVEVTRRAIPMVRAAGGGVICNIGSSSVLAPVPFYAAYRASKAAVSAFSETLRAELAPQGIRVVEIMPGPVDSDMLRHSQETMVAPAGEPYRAVADHMNASKSMVASMIQPAGDAARLIVDAILDDDGPMRYGCDPMSTGMIDAWRRASDEEMMRGMLEQLVPEGAVRPR